MKPKILIVDDDIITLKILKKYLDDDFDIQTESAGYRVIEKIDMYEGLDLILLDIEMPVMNGLQVFENIIKSSKLANTKVAFLSGVANPGIVRGLMGKGASGIIVKTTPKVELIEKITKILNEDNIRDKSPEILVLCGNVNALKGMRDALVQETYVVKVARSIMDAVNYIEVHSPNLMVIGQDVQGTDANVIYENLSAILYKKNIQSIIIDESVFAAELIERVKKALA